MTKSVFFLDSLMRSRRQSRRKSVECNNWKCKWYKKKKLQVWLAGWNNRKLIIFSSWMHHLFVISKRRGDLWGICSACPEHSQKNREKKQNKTKKQTLSQVQLALKCKCKIMPRTRQLLQSLLAAIFLGLLFFWHRPAVWPSQVELTAHVEIRWAATPKN